MSLPICELTCLDYPHLNSSVHKTMGQIMPYIDSVRGSALCFLIGDDPVLPDEKSFQLVLIFLL